jgi:peptidoglycan hydrolase-like protein with peptidoglycan-binding domain
MSPFPLRKSHVKRRAGSPAGASMLAVALLALPIAGAATAAAAAQSSSCRSDFPGGLAATSIADIQQQLLIHGYDPGPADGDLNSRTCRAILAYQTDAGLQPDGIAGPQLQNQLRFGTPRVTASARTNVNPHVAEAQVLLGRLGYLSEPADGISGRKTRDALFRFQMDHNLPVTNLIDDQTVAEIRRVEAAQGQPAPPPEQAPAPATPPAAPIEPGPPGSVPAPMPAPAPMSAPGTTG